MKEDSYESRSKSSKIRISNNSSVYYYNAYLVCIRNWPNNDKTHDYVKTDATIDKIIYEDYRSADDNVSTVTTYYQVSYVSYADCTSKQYTADIVKGMFTNKTENDALTVYYNPDNPEELRPDMSHGNFGVIILGLMLIGIIVIITKGEFK